MGEKEKREERILIYPDLGTGEEELSLEPLSESRIDSKPASAPHKQLEYESAVFAQHTLTRPQHLALKSTANLVPVVSFGLELTETRKTSKYVFSSEIYAALESVEQEIQVLQENIDSLKQLKPECDQVDYALAASSGAICGIIDIFLVAKPANSALGKLSDSWYKNKVKSFAKICGWKSKDTDENKELKNAIRYLEKKFQVPYDHRGAGDIGSMIGLTPSNHHFKSLGHNPTLLGLFFSILDQFNNTGHYASISEGKIKIVRIAGTSHFELRGRSFSAKLISGIVNWIGHLISDVSGSSASSGRGMGIPSPFMGWVNDLILINSKLNLPINDLLTNIYKIAVKIYEEGYDIRFQTAQMIPVALNEMLVRIIYMLRRSYQHYINPDKNSCSWRELWQTYKPLSSPEVKRMLTVAHGTFCVLDIGDATVRSLIKGTGVFTPVEFFLRLNLPGAGRFAISLYGEGKLAWRIHSAHKKQQVIGQDKRILQDYAAGLKMLAEKYDDQELIDFVQDFHNSELYQQAFEKSIQIANKREVSAACILRDKTDIDNYFQNHS